MTDLYKKKRSFRRCIVDFLDHKKIFSVSRVKKNNNSATKYISPFQNRSDDKKKGISVSVGDNLGRKWESHGCI